MANWDFKHYVLKFNFQQFLWNKHEIRGQSNERETITKSLRTLISEIPDIHQDITTTIIYDSMAVPGWQLQVSVHPDHYQPSHHLPHQSFSR